MTESFHAAARLDEVAEGRPKAVKIGGISIALCNVGGKIYAIDNVCTHDDGILVEDDGETYTGCIDGHEIECPRHGARFDVRDGAVLSMPAAYPVKSYATKIENGTIHVKVNIE